MLSLWFSHSQLQLLILTSFLAKLPYPPVHVHVILYFVRDKVRLHVIMYHIRCQSLAK